ncbi:MAG TPA: hypothetical protein VGE26_08115 [Sphingobacteriaceae bacterium]
MMKSIFHSPGPDDRNENKDRAKKQNGPSTPRDEEFEQHYGDLEGGDAGADLPETDHDTEFLE